MRPTQQSAALTRMVFATNPFSFIVHILMVSFVRTSAVMRMASAMNIMMIPFVLEFCFPDFVTLETAGFEPVISCWDSS